MKRALLGLTLGLGLACATGPDADKTDPAGTQQRVKAKKKGKKGARLRPASRIPDPIGGLTTAEICASDDLALIRYRFDTLQKNFAGTCCSKGGLADDMRCELDWPFSDVPSCSAYADIRNGIYARYGYVFEDAALAKRYGKEQWYQPRGDFSEKWLSKHAHLNVSKLKQLEKEKVGCQD